MPEQDIFDSLWADAVEEYENRTERNLAKDEAFRRYRSVQDLEDSIKNEADRFDSFRNEHRKLYSAMAKSIAPMDPILQIIQKGIGNSPYAPACTVFGAASYLLGACKTVSKAYDGLEQLFESMGEITSRLKEYEYGGFEMSLQKKMTTILAYFLDILGMAEQCITRKRFKQWVRSAFMQEDVISNSLAKLRRYMENELGLVIALTYRRVNDIRTTAEETLDDVKNIRRGVDVMLSSQRSDNNRLFSEADEKLVSEALKTRATDEIAREHAANVEKLTRGTGLWIRDDVMFKAWELEQAPILWIFGRPGVGKTMLAARTVEMLQHKYPQHSDIPSMTVVSYMSFKDNNPVLQDCAQLLRAAALQILKTNDRFKKHVIAVISKSQDVFASARRIWQQLFLDFFTEDAVAQSVTSLGFLVVDGLDEGPEEERVKFLACLADLLTCSTAGRKCRIQVAVFARPDVRADPGFEKVSFRTRERIIEVTPERNNVDIEAYIRQRLGDVCVLRVLKQKKAAKPYQNLAKEVYSNVRLGSQGMFLWAKLIFDQIRALPSPEAVRDALRGAPKGLDDMLHHVFKRLEVNEKMHRSYLHDLLSWVYCAYRPLSITELFVLLVIGSSQHCYMIEDDLRSRYSSLFDLTGPLVEMIEETELAEVTESASISEGDDFDFLEDLNISEDDHGGDGADNSESNGSDNGRSTTGPKGEDLLDSLDAFEVPKHWDQTLVAFSHARIRDFLATEGDPSTRRWNDCSIIPENLSLARLKVVLTCCQIMNSRYANNIATTSLKTYAKINGIKHLAEVNFSTISQPLAIQSARALAALFLNGENLMESYKTFENDFIRTWLGTRRFSSLVRDIIIKHRKDLDEEHQAWVSSIKSSFRELFRPLVRAIATKWLTKTGWDDFGYYDKSEGQVWIMYAFSNLTETTDNSSVDRFDVYSEMSDIPLSTLEQLASIEPMEKSEHWYTGLAWIMMEAGKEHYLHRAIELFRIALESNRQGAWVAMEGLAKCYGKLEQYSLAIRQMEEAIQNLPQTMSGINLYLLEAIAGWNLELGYEQESVEAARKAYEASLGFEYAGRGSSDDRTLRSVKSYIEALYRTHSYDDVEELIYELERTSTLESGRSLWRVFLRAQYYADYNVLIFAKVGTMTRSKAKARLRDFMAASVKDVVDLSGDEEGDLPVWLARQVAEWLYRYGEQVEESIQIWQRMITFIDESDENFQQSQAGHRTAAAEALSIMYLDEAKFASNNEQNPSEKVLQLKALALHTQGSQHYYRSSKPALLLGIWLHEYAKAEDEVWRAAVRPSIKQALYLLTDEDPWNDQDAYAQLGMALLAAGDILNASIALGITLKPLEDLHCKFLRQENKKEARSTRDPSDEVEAEDSKSPISVDQKDLSSQDELDLEPSSSKESTESAASDEDEDANKKDINPDFAYFGTWWACDGPCEAQQSSYTELYFCRICNRVCFCQDCMVLVRSGRMLYKYCGSDHDLVRMFPLVEEAEQMTKMLMDRNFEKHKKWLDDLKRAWDA